MLPLQIDRSRSTLQVRWIWLPVPVFVIIAILFHFLDFKIVAESQEVLTTLNTLFCAAASFLITYLAGLTFRDTNSEAVLSMGCGALTFGIISTLVGPMLGNFNAAVTMHNVGVFVSGFFFLLSAWIALYKRTSIKSNAKTSLKLMLTYLVVVLIISLLVWSAFVNIIPPFYIKNYGFTQLRNVILSLSVLEFFVAAILLLSLFSRSGNPFLMWYSIGLLLLGLGFAVVVVAGVPGSPLSWLGRSGQYLGSVYMLVAIHSITQGVAGLRIPLEEALRVSENRLRILNENLENIVVQRTEQVRALSKALILAEQKERLRLSIILHEDVQQTLFAIKTRFQLLKDELKFEKETQSDADELERLIAKALNRSKMLAIEFNPPVLKNEGLDAALRWLALHMEQQYGLKVDIIISDSYLAVQEEERVLLVQIVRELLFNVVKHANTKHASLVVSNQDSRLIIVVEDKGIGFSLEDVRKKWQKQSQMGLFSIEERLRLFGGKLEIESKQDSGTVVKVTLPFDNKMQQFGVG